MSSDRAIDGSVLAAVFGALPEAMIIFDEHGRVVEGNPASQRLLGWERADLLRLSFGELIRRPHRRAGSLAGALPISMDGPSSLVGEAMRIDALARDDTTLPCDMSVTRLELDGPPLYLASLRGRREIETRSEARDEAQDALWDAFDEQSTIILCCDADKRITFCNDAACRYFDLPANRIIGNPLPDELAPDIREQFETTLAELTPEAPVIHGTSSKELSDGETLWLKWTHRAFFDENGHISSYRAIGLDITEQVQHRQALAASEARLAAFMRNAPVGMYIKDGKGRYVTINPEMEKVFGKPASEVIGLTAGELMPQDLVQVIDLADAKIRQSGRPSAIEEHLPGAENYQWTLVVRFPIDVGNGGPVYIGGFDIDISTIKAAEAELTLVRDVLHRSEKLNTLGVFAASIAHELNNPLAALTGQAELLQIELAEHPVAERAKIILAAATRCARIVRSTLSMALQQSPRHQATDLHQVVENALEMASHSLRNANVEVVTRTTDASPIVAADPDQMHQVILNLAINAKQAMAEKIGERRLTISTALSPSGDSAVVDVIDTGPGIADDIADRVFETFYSTKLNGTGIGLAYCKRVVETHKGRISLVPCETGAHFRIVLPVGTPIQEEQPSDLPEGAFAGKHALVIDDEDVVADAFAAMLQSEGLDVTVAYSGREGLEHLSDSEFDFIITDVNMPEVDGVMIVEWLKSERPALVERTLFVTGTLLDENQLAQLRRTKRPHLEKPFALAELKHALASIR